MADDARQQPGHVWFTASHVLSGNDVKAGRPVAIVQGPRFGRVQVWARTTQLDVRGIMTPARVLPGLTRPGVFAPRHTHSIEVERFREPVCRYLGLLPEPYLKALLDEWERY
jgi:mRNA-degrading endonuclease toxin of MazEF toxin-antitoxin module